MRAGAMLLGMVMGVVRVRFRFRVRVRFRFRVGVMVRVRPGCGLLSGRVAAMGAEGHEKSCAEREAE